MAAGPPPGLGMAAPPAAALPPNPFGANGSQAATHKSPLAHNAVAAVAQPTNNYQRPADCPRIYSRGALLAYSSSMLVARPTSMAPLRDWYGEWEPYHHKSTYNYRDTPRRHHAEESAASHAAEGEDGANNGGIIGGALGGFGPRREGAGARFGGRRNEDRERGEGGLRLGEVSSRRVAPAGKNPFGQISASGTFKPAGTPGGGRGPPRDGHPDGFGDGRRSGMGERSTSYGKDRMREMLPDDRRRDAARDRRRGERGLEADESREEGEISESPRIRRTGGGADTASDWRRPGDRDRAGPFSSIASDRLRPSERRGAQRGGGGAPWAADADDNPAWLEDDSEPLPVDNRAPFGQFGSRRNEADGADDLRGDDMAGAVDSIQAFKAQMKERERRERLARGEPEPVDNTGAYEGARGSSLGADRDASGDYAFGSGETASRESELEAIRQEMMAAANQRSTSGASLYDSISNSHGGAGADGSGPPGLPVRSSRFARFFGGGQGGPPRDPQAAALAAQQKMLESMGNHGTDDKDGTSMQSPQSPPNASSSSINISELFSKTSIRDKGDGAQKDASGNNVSEADQQSMQKLMAMLQGGGSGSGTPTQGKAPGADSADQLKELLRGQGRGQRGNGDEGVNERPRSIVSPSPSSAEAHHHPGMDARSPLPYHQQQEHQRESSLSSAQMPVQQQQQQQQQQHQQQQHEQYPQYHHPQQQQQQHQRSESPSIYNNDPRQQLGGLGSPGSPGGPGGVGSPGPAPGMAGFGGFPGGMAGRPPPPGMDPRLMGRPPMGGPGGFQQMPPHIAASLGLARGPMPPGMGNMPPVSPLGGVRGPPPPPPNGAFPPGFFAPGSRPPPPPGMPPQLYQQLMSMPPHIQQQVLAGQGFAPGMPMPPRSPYDLAQAGGGEARRSASPATNQLPYYAQPPNGGASSSPVLQQQQQQHQGGQQGQGAQQVNVGSHAMGGANLMALLSGGRNTPTS